MAAEDCAKDDGKNHGTKQLEAQKLQKPVHLRRNLGLIYGTTAMRTFSVALVMQTNTTVLLDHFKGDFAAQAHLMSSLMSLSVACGVVLNPIFASLCDVFGRKHVLLSGLCGSLFNRVLCSLHPSFRNIVLTHGVAPLCQGHTLGTETMLGDIFQGDAVGYGGAKSKMMLGALGGMTICPVLASWLGQRFGKAVPYRMAALIEFVSLTITWLFVQETLEDIGSAKEFKFQSASPLSFLKLFRQNMRFSFLTVMHLLNMTCDKLSTGQVLELYRQEIFSFSMKERAQFASISALMAFPGYASAGTFMKRFGTSACVWMGLSMYILEMLVMSFSRRSRTFYLILPLGLLRSAAASSISAMMQDEVRKIGMKQGEFQGCLSNIRTLASVATPLFWARCFAYGSQRGKPQFFLHVMMLCVFAQLFIERCVSAHEDDTTPKILDSPSVRNRRVSWLAGTQ